MSLNDPLYSCSQKDYPDSQLEIIVFDKLELIIIQSWGLTLSTSLGSVYDVDHTALIDPVPEYVNTLFSSKAHI